MNTNKKCGCSSKPLNMDDLGDMSNIKNQSTNQSNQIRNEIEASQNRTNMVAQEKAMDDDNYPGMRTDENGNNNPESRKERDIIDKLKDKKPY